MGASLMQRRRVRDDGLRVGKPLLASKKRKVTVGAEKAPANYVPAAAVIRRARALSGIIGRKGLVGGWSRLVVKSSGSAGGVRWGTGWLECGRGGWELLV